MDQDFDQQQDPAIPDPTGADHLTTLPNELQQHVDSFLSNPDLLSMTDVSQDAAQNANAVLPPYLADNNPFNPQVIHPDPYGYLGEQVAEGGPMDFDEGWEGQQEEEQGPLTEPVAFVYGGTFNPNTGETIDEEAGMEEDHQ